MRASFSIYSRTSITRTPLGPKKFNRDMGNSSHGELILALDLEANGDNLGNVFDLLDFNGMLNVLLESHQ